MRNAVKFKPLLFLALLGLVGCATNALRVEYARDVATQGKAAAAASRAFLDRVEAGRQELDIELLSADPACSRPGNVSLVRNEALLGPRAPARGWLCVPYRWTATGIQINRGPIAEQLKPTLLLIDSLSAYSGALAEIVAEPSADASSPINDAIATARAFQDVIVAATGATNPPLNDDRVAAVTGFITFLSELQREQGQVRQLRQLMVEHPQGAHDVITALRRRLTIWEGVRHAEDGARTSVNNIMLAAVINRQPPATPAARREALRANYDRRAATEASRLLAPALNDLLTTLDRADADLRRILRENPDLNPRERRRVAELNRQRIVRALERVTALITAFRGI